MKTVVVYQSRYGSAEQYARWIAEELGCECLDASTTGARELSAWDCIIFGGGIFAGKIEGVFMIARNYDLFRGKTLVVYSVGLSEPADDFSQAIREANFQGDVRENVNLFHFQGGIDFKKLTFLHRAMMRMIKRAFQRTKDLTPDQQKLMEAYGGAVDYSDRSSIAPLIAFVREKEAQNPS